MGRSGGAFGPSRPPHARQKLLEALAKLTIDFGFLEAKTGRLGIDALLDDLRSISRVIPPDSETSADVRALLRILDRESHILRRWNPDQHPALFAQQVHNRAVDLGLVQRLTAPAARLAFLGKPHLLLRWRAGGESFALERTFVGRAQQVNAVRVTADGTRAVTASVDGALRVWNLSSGQILCTLPGHGDKVTAVRVTADGTRVVLASQDSTLQVWSLATGQQLATLIFARLLESVAIAPDGITIVAGDQGGGVSCLRYVDPSTSANISDT